MRYVNGPPSPKSEPKLNESDKSLLSRHRSQKSGVQVEMRKYKRNAKRSRLRSHSADAHSIFGQDFKQPAQPHDMQVTIPFVERKRVEA
jgi:hypothetical protein